MILSKLIISLKIWFQISKRWATHLMITCTDFGPLIQNQIYSGSTTYMVVIVPGQDLK